MRRSRGSTSASPTATAARSADPEFGQEADRAPSSCRRRRSSARTSRRSACGSTPGTMFPAEYRSRIFIAEHGSWNRSSASRLPRRDGDARRRRGHGHEPFATGWLQGDEAWGRPVDVLVMPDGALLVSRRPRGRDLPHQLPGVVDTPGLKPRRRSFRIPTDVIRVSRLSERPAPAGVRPAWRRGGGLRLPTSTRRACRTRDRAGRRG